MNSSEIGLILVLIIFGISVFWIPILLTVGSSVILKWYLHVQWKWYVWMFYVVFIFVIGFGIAWALGFPMGWTIE